MPPRPGLLLLIILAAAPASGQALSATPDLKDGLRQATDSTIALSAGPEVGTGVFTLDKSEFFDTMDASQIKLRIYVGPWFPFGETRKKHPDPPKPEPLPDDPLEEDKAWFEHLEDVFQLSEPEIIALPPRLRFFAFLNYGSNLAVSDARQLPTNGPILGRDLSPKAEVQIDSVSLRAGGGVRLDIFRWLAVLPTFTASYNNVHGVADGDRIDIAILKRDYDKILVDWRSESFTYIPELEVRFTFDYFSPLAVYLTVYASYLTTHVFSSTTKFQDFSSNSLMGVLLLEFDWNTGWNGFFGQDLHVIPTFRYTRVEGDAVAGLGTRDLVSIELAIEFDTTETVPFSSRLGIHLRYIFGVDLDAWSVGASHEF